MSKNICFRIFAAVLVAGLLFGAVAPRQAVAVQTEPPDGPLQPEQPLSPGGSGAQPNPLSKVDSELRQVAEEGGAVAVEVYILAKAGADLSGVVDVRETRPFPAGQELVVATVKPAMIPKMASHPDVIAAEVFHAIEAPIPLTPKEDAGRMTKEKADELRAQAAAVFADPEGNQKALPIGAAPSGTEGVDDWNGASLIGAPEAWAKGYTGEGVDVAIIDSGVDFGHPDLQDNIAFYEDGPYAGWPIALDPYSMRNYYYNGYDSWDNYWSWYNDPDLDDNLSWYAGVSDVIYCAGGSDEGFWFDDFWWTIDQELVDLSLSGEIRWGVHPDIQIPNYVTYYGDWMPFILLDTQEAGVYDTVIGDLNFDGYFDQFDDTAVLGTDDPVLAQDFGSYVYTDTVVMTGTAYIPSYAWYYPPLWFLQQNGQPYITEGEETLPAGSFILGPSHYTEEGATDGSDGIAEFSGGMVYYIADGELPVPGMDFLYPGIGPAYQDPIPLNGHLVAFMLGSDYADGGDHGTLCASAATADGQIKGYFGMFGEFVQYDPEDWSSFFDADDVSEYLPFLKPADVGTVQGAAPGAGIIAMGQNYNVVNGMQGFYDAYTFLAYGVDGTPNSGDEFVDIASMSYGDGSVHNDGWDWESRLLTYYNTNYLPNTTFFNSSGNGGPGFGTVNSPGGATAIGVGASTLYGSSTVFGSAIAQDQINDGEVVHFSGRGPDAMGAPDPEVVATGGWGAGDGPLNMSAIYNYSYGAWFPGDGNNAWYEWGGTSRAAPEAAGVMATIYQAYMEANGAFPDYETAGQILMAGATDLNHDVLMQGAGRVNADTGTDIAAGLGGVYASPGVLAAGEYKGTQYDSFANLLFPGDEWSQTFTVKNPGATAASVTLGDEVLMEMETLNYEQVVRPYLGTEGPYPWTYYYSADYLVSADPELASGYAMLRVAHASPDAPAVEVCVDGSTAVDYLEFKQITGYLVLPPADYFVEVFGYDGVFDCSGAAVISATLTLDDATDYTVVATDYLQEITPVVLVDDNSAPDEGFAHVRFFHASPDAPAVDVAIAGGGPVLFSDIAFQEASPYLPVEAGTYDLEVRATGTITPVVLSIPDINFSDGEVYTVFAMGELMPEEPVGEGGDGSLEWLYQDTVGTAVADANSGQTIAYPGAYRYTPYAPTLQANILVYVDDWAHPAPNTYVEQALSNLGLAATVHVNGDYAGFQSDLNTGGPWDLVILASENYIPPGGLTTDLLNYVNSGGNLALTYWYMLNYSTDPLWSALGFDYIANDLSAPPVNWWEPTNPIFTTPQSAPEWLVRIPRASISDGQYLEPTIVGRALGGYPNVPTPNEASLITRADGKIVTKGFLDATFDADSDTDGILDGVELWENIITQGLAQGSLDAILEQDTPLPARPVSHGPDLSIPVPEGADFMEVELTIPFEIFDFCYDDPDPDSICYGGQHRWSLTVFDWTDRNADGQLWLDANADEVVSVNFGDLVDISATGQVTQTELSRFTYAYNHANIQGATVRLGEREDIDNVVLGLVHNVPNGARGDEDYYEENPLLVKVVFYEKVDWPIVAESAATLAVPAGGESTFDATFTIPEDMPPGLYEGAITIDDGIHTSIIPVTVNVAVPKDELLFTLGGNEDSGIPYDNGRMGAGYTWSSVLEEGDWRFYYYDAETGLDQQYLYVRNRWGDQCLNMPTFNETLVWGPNTGDQFSLMDPEQFGPYSLQFAGGTPYANTGDPFGWYAPRVWAGWWDGDSIPQPESRAWATLWDGLNQVQFRNVLMSGNYACGEGYEATAGVFGVDAPESGILINTDQDSGSFTLDAVSPVDGLWAYPYGFGSEQAWTNQVVPQGKHTDFPPDDLMDGWVYEFEAVNVSGITLALQGPNSSDVDLFLLFDANGDGVYNQFDNRELIGWSTYGGSWEDLTYDGGQGLPFVADGTYAVVMYGYEVLPGDTFDLRMWLYGGEGLTIEGADQDNYYILDTTAGELGEVTVNWQVDGPGIWSGYLVFGMPWEESPSSYNQGPEIFVPVTINKEGALVDIQKDVDKLMADWGEILTYTITISNEGSNPAGMEVTDVLPAGLELINDWTDFDGITSTLAVAAPELFGIDDDTLEDGECWMHYDGYRRSVRYGCHLPVEYNGEFYTSDTISFRVRVEAQPGDTFLNKADLKFWPWDSWWDIPYTYISDTAYSFVPLKLLLPLITR